MIESLLILGCYFGTADSCLYTAEGYYSYSGIEAEITEKSKLYTQKHPVLASALGWSMALASDQVTVPIKRDLFLTLSPMHEKLSVGIGF